jgi:hypothetical protein
VSRFTVAEIARVRREFALSIGSCSFDEPVSEIRALGAVLDGAPPEESAPTLQDRKANAR